MTDSLMAQALAALSRGHSLFAGGVTDADLGDTPAQLHARANGISAIGSRAPGAVQSLHRLADTDKELTQIMTSARADHARGSTATRTVLEAAKADATPAADTPMGRREAMTRMVARLRAQQRHIALTRSQARLHALRLRHLRYSQSHRGQSGRAEVLVAIRKALDVKGIHDPAARARWTRSMDLVARRESNYNANAVNDWDSNAAKGTPSIGAWQFIAPTFAAYHEPGTSPSIHNLVSQACAFINYARGRYGVAVDASDLADRIQQADPRRSPKGY